MPAVYPPMMCNAQQRKVITALLIPGKSTVKTIICLPVVTLRWSASLWVLSVIRNSIQPIHKGATAGRQKQVYSGNAERGKAQVSRR
ncbi:hypothetical protein BaRGS_00006796 [Batillaria attramentaria]|uniref:Uncharacterized protein n=1 Tax=Batillaria attramentaria TaxID=370345 RepID=A0ABD0LST1_9CAEN